MTTDFNDMPPEIAAAQLSAAASAEVIPLHDSPPPSVEVSQIALDYALQRFSLVMPENKVWDAQEKKLLKPSSAKSWWGGKVFKDWNESDKRGVVRMAEVLASLAATQDGGGGELGDALARYIYLYPTDSVWDVKLREIVPMSAIKYAIADSYDRWIKHPRRRQINREGLVFDPGGPWEKDGRINMFRGLPIKPIKNIDGCRNIRALLWHLSNKDKAVFDWICKWLAFPLKNVGAKMATAIIMHSDVQGTGKSLLFDEVMRRIYGDYGATLGQHQLESQYTDWRSQKLFCLFEEIFSREQKYSHTGTVKHMITGRTHRIEKKFVSGWEEANHMNAVFLSNEFQPWPIEAHDRRMLVVWPETKLTEEMRVGVIEDLAGGGANAFMDWLLSIDLGDFHTHTEPPMTSSKQRLIDFGTPGWELFYRDWKYGYLPVPYMTCLVNDLYEAYKHWCAQAGERSLSREKFSGFISSKVKRRRDVSYRHGQSLKNGTFFSIDQPTDGVTLADYYAGCIQKFQQFMQKGGDA